MPSRPVIVGVVALAIAGACMFLLVAEDLFDGGGLVAHDPAVLTWFVDHRTPELIRAAKFVSTLGGFVGLFAIGAVLLVWLRARGCRIALALAPLVALGLASLASTIAKSYFGRDRPPTPLHATTVTLAAFPSGHATDAAAFFLAAASILALTVAPSLVVQALVMALGLFLAGLVGISRLVLGVHWPSDVVAGWALGSSVGLLVVLTTWVFTSRRVEAEPVPA